MVPPKGPLTKALRGFSVPLELPAKFSLIDLKMSKFANFRTVFAVSVKEDTVCVEDNDSISQRLNL